MNKKINENKINEKTTQSQNNLKAGTTQGKKIQTYRIR